MELTERIREHHETLIELSKNGIEQFTQEGFRLTRKAVGKGFFRNVRASEPVNGSYTRKVLIGKKGGPVIMVMGWPADTNYPIHDHQFPCFEFVLSGVQSVQDYEIIEDGEICRLKDAGTTILYPNNGAMVRPDGGVHAIGTNLERVVSLHVYAGMPTWTHHFHHLTQDRYEKKRVELETVG